MNRLAIAAFLAFGAILVLFGANASEIIHDLELDYADFGLVASMLSMGIGCGILIAGPLVDRLPRRPLFVAACASVGVATLSLGPNTSFGLLLAASFTIGFGAGFYETLLNAVIVEESEGAAPRRLLFIHSAATLGASVTPFAIGLLREPLALAWYDTFRAAGVLHLVLLLGVMALPEKRISSAPATAHAGSGDTGAKLLLAVICIVTFAYVGVESAMTFFIAEYAQRTLELPPSRSAAVVGFFWIGLLCSRLATGLLPWAPSANAVAALSSVASLIAGAFFVGLDLPPELAMLLTGLFLGGVFPIMIGFAGLTLRGATGTAVAFAAGLGSIGGFVIPWLTGILANATSLETALSTLSAWLLVLAVASAAVGRLRLRDPRQTE